MDFFEKQIKEKREEFDQVERVDEGLLWQSIQSEMNPPAKKIGRRFSLLQVYAVAASVALLAMASFLFFQKEEVVPTELRVESFFPEQKEYIQTVSEKETELNLNQLDKNQYQDIFSELQLLEEIHREFKKDMPAILNQERKINILQKYYERKIRILEQLSKEIEKKSHYEKRINERPM